MIEARDPRDAPPAGGSAPATEPTASAAPEQGPPASVLAARTTGPEGPRAAPALPVAEGFRWSHVLLAGLIAAYAVVLLRTAWISDDAYITLRTVDNLVHGHGPRWNVAERVQSYTHPLWMLLLSAAYFLTREAFFTTVALCTILSIATAGLLAWSSRTRPWAAGFGLIVWILSRAFVDFSTSGLENSLTHLLVLVFVLALLREPRDARSVLALSLVAGLATLNRPDAILLVAPGLCATIVLSRRRETLLAAAAGLLPLLVWEIFAVAYYGLPVPNTALAKLRAGIPAGELAAQGLAYLGESVRHDPLTVAVVALGASCGLASRRGAAVAAAAGAGLYVAWVVRIGGDFMSGRFLTAPFVVATVLFVHCEASRRRLVSLVLCGIALFLGLATPHPTVTSGSDYGLRHDALIDPHGVTDERAFHFHALGLFNGQAGWQRPLAAMTLRGRELRRTGTTLTVEEGVGVVGYYAGPAVHILDTLALGDPLLARLPAVERDPSFDRLLRLLGHPPSSRGWRSGHFHRNVPEGYFETLLTGANRLRDPRLARLYDDVVRVTRGPLWSAERLRSIVRLNLGRHDPPDAPARPPFEAVPWDVVLALAPTAPEGPYRRGLLRLRGGRVAEAAEDFERTLAIDPAHYFARTNLAEIRLEAGRRSEAYDLARSAVALRPEIGEAHLILARCLWSLSHFDEAAVSFLRAAELDRSIAAGALENAGRAMLDADRPADAVRWIEKAVASDPGYAGAWTSLGIAQLRAGRPARAVESFERALVLQRDDSDAVLGLADAWEAANDLARSVEALQEFLRANPARATVHFRLGELLAKRGDRAGAEVHWREAARLGYPSGRRAPGEPSGR